VAAVAVDGGPEDLAAPGKRLLKANEAFPNADLAVAVLVPKRAHFLGDCRATGPLAHHVRLLEQFGYQVVVIPYWVYRDVKKKKQEAVYLAKEVRKKFRLR